MRQKPATLFAAAAAMLTATPPVRASAPEALFGRLCAAHPGGVPLPAPVRRRDERPDCPGACHAACTRSTRGDGEDEGE